MAAKTTEITRALPPGFLPGDCDEYATPLAREAGLSGDLTTRIVTEYGSGGGTWHTVAGMPPAAVVVDGGWDYSRSGAGTRTYILVWENLDG